VLKGAKSPGPRCSWMCSHSASACSIRSSTVALELPPTDAAISGDWWCRGHRLCQPFAGFADL